MRFPAGGLERNRGVVHATVVVNGNVYFGTETTPTFYKLTPGGRLKWSYRPGRPEYFSLPAIELPTAGFMNAALVTNGAVFCRRHGRNDLRARPGDGRRAVENR